MIKDPVNNNDTEVKKEPPKTDVPTSSPLSEIIVLDVGGKRFKTTRDTLVNSAPQSMLARMFDPANNSLLRPQEDGSYFFDRSGELFKFILMGLRDADGVPNSVPGIPKTIWENELGFWQLANRDIEQNNARKKRPRTETSVPDIETQLQVHAQVLVVVLMECEEFKAQLSQKLLTSTMDVMLESYKLKKEKSCDLDLFAAALAYNYDFQCRVKLSHEQRTELLQDMAKSMGCKSIGIFIERLNGPDRYRFRIEY